MHARHDRAQVSKACLVHKSQVDKEKHETPYRVQESSRGLLAAATCSIKLRTAKAGGGKPCAKVALCTPPDIGVLNKPALDPLESVLVLVDEALCDLSDAIGITPF